MRLFRLSNTIVIILISLLSFAPLGLFFYINNKNSVKEKEFLLKSYSMTVKNSLDSYLKNIFSKIRSLEISLGTLKKFDHHRFFWDQKLLSLMYGTPLIKGSGMVVGEQKYDLIVKPHANPKGFRSFLAQPHLKEQEITEILYNQKGHKEATHSYKIPENYFSSLQFFSKEFELILGDTAQEMASLVQKDLKPHWSSPSLMSSSSGVIFLAYPLRKESCLLGTLFLSFDFSEFTKEIRQLIGKTHGMDVLIYDGNNKIIFSSDSKNIYTKDNQGKEAPRTIKNLKIPNLHKAIKIYTKNPGSFNTGDSPIYVKNKTFLFSNFSSDLNTQWTLVTSFPTHFYQNQTSYLVWIIGIGTAFFGALVISIFIFLNRKMYGWLRQIASSLTQSLSGKSIEPISTSFKEFQEVTDSIKTVNRGLVMLRKFIPDRWLSKVFDEKAPQLISERESLTITYCTLSNFSEISHHLSPEQLTQYVCHYLGDIATIIDQEGGSVDQYIGESLQASCSQDAQEISACHAALKCLLHLDTVLNPALKSSDFPEADLRWGLSQGYGILGYVGSDKKMQYTVLGYCVTQSKFLADLNSIYGTRILLDDTIKLKVAQEFIVRPIDQININGQQTMIYELLGRYGDKHLDIYQGYLAQLTESAWQAYTDQHWKEAGKLYEKILAEFPEDSVASLFIERCSKKIKK
jgi:class 3 adenylate cyclase